jgi:methionine-rich copper-binding protein CopC
MRRIVPPSIALLMLTAGPAFAHAHLEASEPSAGAVLVRPPTRLRLRFNEIVRLPGSGVELAYPDGRTRRLGPLTRDPGDVFGVLSPLPPSLAPGRYAIRWRALSPNAHRTHGDFGFTVRR